MGTLLHTFTQPLLAWYDVFGRKELPWKRPVDAYRIWLSEVMLQQTQVKTVIPYFLRFIERFPNISALANAQEDEVLSMWSGLGYYSRGRNLHQTAQMITRKYNSLFPRDIQTLVQLPGIGPSTAAAIASQAFNQPTAILDGNVKRVLSRFFMIDGVSGQTENRLWERAQGCMSHERPADYTQAIMDLGATLCTAKNPQCTTCPLNRACLANLNAVVSDYPSKKIKKERPNKHQQFLLIYNENGEIFLEKRPPKGVWGGLWCTPSIDMDVDARWFVQTTYFSQVLNVQPLMNIKHSFTHFRLNINALSINIKHLPTENQNGWFSHSQTIKLGLAKPISDMIERFYGTI